MRKGAALADILKLRRQVSEHAPIYEEYPITFEQRYSVRSSRHPSRLDLLRHSGKVQPGSRRKDIPHLPLPVTTQRFTSRDAYYRYYWKERAHPSTPRNVIADYFADNASPSTPKKPEPAFMKETSVESLNSSKHSARLSMPPTISVRDLSIVEAEPPTPTSTSCKDQYTRWSWTNSEAPSTPRMNFDKSDAISHHKREGHMSPIVEDIPVHVGGLSRKQSQRQSRGMRSVLVRNFPG